jgi:hypothetical protein
MRKKPRKPLSPSQSALLGVAAITLITLLFVAARLWPQLTG